MNRAKILTPKRKAPDQLAFATMVAILGGALSCDMVDQTVATPVEQPPLCSQARRAIAQWQKREAEECRPDISGALELTALGDGRLLFRRRLGGQDQLVVMRGTSFDAPISVLPPTGDNIDGHLAGYAPLPPAPGQPVGVLLYDPRVKDWLVYGTQDPVPPSVDRYPQRFLVAPQKGVWPAGPATQGYWKPGTWDSPWGHAFLGLGDGYVMDRDVGTGAYRLWRFISSANDGHAQLLEPDTFIGGPRPEFRRGHRLVYLGPGKLLEWMPHPCVRDTAAAPACLGADYRVWSYDLGGGGPPHDPFSNHLVSSGMWESIGEDHDIVLGDPQHLVVWTRSEGSLRSLAFDADALGPAAPDPLVGTTVAMTTMLDIKSGPADPPTTSPTLRNIVVILQDGRSFDSYFGRYCTGVAGPEGPPSCTDGPSCCEAMPSSVRGAPACHPLDPATDTRRPNDTPACVRAKMNQGHMDGFADAPATINGTPCGDPGDFACVGDDPGPIGIHHTFAASGALADRFFQTYAFDDGPPPQTALPSPFVQNFIYLVTTRYTQNLLTLRNSSLLTKELVRLQVPWAMYTGDATTKLLWQVQAGPEFYDPLWSPYRSLKEELDADIDQGQLPSVVIVMPEANDAERSEGPGHPFATGIEFTKHVIDTVLRSPQASSTLILLAYSTAGGYFDHVKPPEDLDLRIDATTGGADAARIHYGQRVPLVALGRFARKNHIAHEPMEMSSISAFLEWNWLSSRSLKGPGDVATDLRSYRDVAVRNLGGLLDPDATVVPVPNTSR